MPGRLTVALNCVCGAGAEAVLLPLNDENTTIDCYTVHDFNVHYRRRRFVAAASVHTAGC